jgi:twinkle protein
MKSDHTQEFLEMGVDKMSRASRNGEFKARCPKCKDDRKPKNKNDKPFSGNIYDGRFNCHNCGFKGTVKTYMRDHTKPYNPEKTWDLVERPSDEQAKAEPGTSQIWKYLNEQRGLSLSTLLDEHVRAVSSIWFPKVNERRRAIQFNYADHLGNIVKRKYRDGAGNYISDAGGTSILYRLDRVHSSEEVLICEGELDALSWVEAGYDNAVSLPDGAKSIDALSYCLQFLQNVQKFYIATDADEPGQSAAEEIARRVGKPKCLFVKFPDECKDSNEVLTKHGPARLLQCKDEAKPYPVEGILDVAGEANLLDIVWKHGYPPGAKTGIHTLDQIWGWYKGDVYVVTGYPNHGKSPFVDFCALSLAVHHGWRWGVFSPEYDRFGIYLIRLMTQFTGKEYSQKHMPELEKDRALEFLNDHFFEIRPENGDYRASELENLINILVTNYGINGIILDNFSNINKESEDQHNNEFVRNFMNRLRLIANMYSICIVLVAHPRKSASPDAQPPEIKSLAEVSGSAHFNNLAKGGLSVYRHMEEDSYSGQMQDRGTYIRVLKSKMKNHAKVGASVELDFDKESERYSPAGSVKPPPDLLPDIIGQDGAAHFGQSLADLEALDQMGLPDRSMEAVNTGNSNTYEVEENDIPF